MKYSENMSYNKFLEFMANSTENLFVHTESSQRVVRSNGQLFVVDSEDYEESSTDGYVPLSENTRAFEYNNETHYEVSRYNKHNTKENYKKV
jgi:hypothetical protein